MESQMVEISSELAGALHRRQAAEDHLKVLRSEIEKMGALAESVIREMQALDMVVDILSPSPEDEPVPDSDESEQSGDTEEASESD